MLSNPEDVITYEQEAIPAKPTEVDKQVAEDELAEFRASLDKLSDAELANLLEAGGPPERFLPQLHWYALARILRR